VAYSDLWKIDIVEHLSERNESFSIANKIAVRLGLAGGYKHCWKHGNGRASIIDHSSVLKI